ncbi:MAG: penicillin-binding protein 2 [Gammaproteobacteria bacterium]|nr:MAG: penicillin-binding protein 2 [Gammaproteobacteria bacterium]
MNEDRAIKNPMQEYRLYVGRLLFTLVVVLIMAGVLLWRYYHLQVLEHEGLVTLSDRNRVLVESMPPTRGLIYDRNGVLLADNRPSFNLSIVKERAGDLDTLIAELDQLVGVSEVEVERFHKQLQRRRRPYEPVPLKVNLDEREQGVLAVNEYRLPGVEVTVQLLRHYPLGPELSHVLGYVGRINDQEIQELDPVRYSGTLVVGKTGLEKFYEDELLGEVGYQTVETNARGRVMRQLERAAPEPGQDLHLYLDSRLQHVAFESLEGERGAVVAIEVATGGVLAMASAPSFDANEFVTGISFENYRALLDSPDRPLFDRVLQGQYPPGSTVKPIYGLAALQSGTISQDYRIYDPGFYQLKNDERKYRDWKKGGHGSRIYLSDAIIQSCDTFFYDVGVKMTIDTLAIYGTRFGLGQKTGLDMPSERSGIMPSRPWKRAAKGIAWYPGDTVNTSIGQGFTLATPMQLAVATSRLASRGEIRSPQLVRKQHGIPPPAGIIKASESNWNYVHTAMQEVVHGLRGTAKGINKGLEYHIAGKTGTAQVIGIKQDEEYDAEKVAKRNRDHALFIAFAPVENPKIAVSVLVENGEHGSSTAAPVARKLIDAYMSYYPDALAGEVIDEPG